MTSKESGSGSNYDLPREFLEVLPADPFEQLDIARKITSIALSTRVEALESETSDLRMQLRDKDAAISGLESQLQSLDSSLGEVSDKVAVAQQDKALYLFTARWKLLGENIASSCANKVPDGAPDITGEGISEVKRWT